MKRKALAVVFISIIVITGAILLFLGQNENQFADQDEAENDVEIEIIDFLLADNVGNPAGITYDRWFNVTIENKGETNATGLYLDIEVFINNTECDNYNIAHLSTSTFNSTLNIGEIREFHGTVLAPMNGPLFFERKPEDEIFIQFRVMMNDNILDEIRIPF